MNKFLITTIGLAVLFVVSGIFNIVQYNDAKVTKEKLNFFESHFGSYEQLLASLKQVEGARYKREHTMTLFIKRGISESQILALKSMIQEKSGVQSVEYISAEQALSDFKARHTDDQLTLQALNELGENPLEASLAITISDPSVKQSLMTVIQSSDKSSIVDRMNP